MGLSPFIGEDRFLSIGRPYDEPGRAHDKPATTNGGRDMPKLNALNPRAIYLYAVSFVTLMMMIFAAVKVAQQVASIAYGPVEYTPGPLEIRARYAEQARQGNLSVSEDLIRQQAEFEAERSRRNRVSYAIRDLAQNVALLLIATPLYFYHWRKAHELDKTLSAKGELVSNAKRPNEAEAD